MNNAKNEQFRISLIVAVLLPTLSSLLHKKMDNLHNLLHKKCTIRKAIPLLYVNFCQVLPLLCNIFICLFVAEKYIKVTFAPRYFTLRP